MSTPTSTRQSTRQSTVQPKQTEFTPRVDQRRSRRTEEIVLDVNDLRVYYFVDAGTVKGVDGISFSLRKGTRLGLVGESGSGKSTAALALMRLIRPPGRIESGQILLDGTDVTEMSDDDVRRFRLSEISMIPQGAMNSLNPVIPIREQILDALRDHDIQMSRAETREFVANLLESVDLPANIADRYPHELSGGMKQRVCIAIGISMQPKVIIADEATSGLDVVVQRQVMETIGRLQEEMGNSVILIGHDMGLMAQFVDELAVLYTSKMMELGAVEDIFTEPLHPYTQLLISSLPGLEKKGRLQGIPGLPPSQREMPDGCVFHPRCPYAEDVCRTDVPVYEEAKANHFVACHFWRDIQAGQKAQTAQHDEIDVSEIAV